MSKRQWQVFPVPGGIIIYKLGKPFGMVCRPWVKADGKLIRFSNWQIAKGEFRSIVGDLSAVLEFKFLSTGLRCKLIVSAQGMKRWEMAAPLETKIVLSNRTRLWHQGAHSWSEARVMRADELLPNLAGHEKILGAPLSEDLPEDRLKRYYQSATCGAIYDPFYSQAMVIGICDAERLARVHLSLLDAKEQQYRLTALSELDGILSEEADSGWWYFNIAEPGAKLFADYAEEFSKLCRPRISPALQGWCSWYYHYQQVNEEDVLRAVEAIKTGSWPLKVVQLDDGYQSVVGDWLETNEKFPHGLSWLASKIKEAGLTPGIWLAPFIADETSKLFRQNPDWFVKNPQNKEPVFQEIWGRKQHSLDTTNPDVLEWLRQLSKALYKAGFAYLKLDFLYSACLPGERFNSAKTTAQALRNGLKAIRAGAPRAYLLGCGCPLAPAVGVVDAMRIGPDVAPSWRPNEFYGTWAAIRNSYNRWFMRRFWQNDPDVIIVRDFDNYLSDSQIRASARCQKDSGRFIFTSDPLEKLSNPQAKILRKLLKSVVRQKKAWSPKNPFEAPFPGHSIIQAILFALSGRAKG